MPEGFQHTLDDFDRIIIDQKLSLYQKIVFIAIRRYCDAKGMFRHFNSFIEEKTGIKVKRIEKILSVLSEDGYISRDTHPKGLKKGSQRTIKISRMYLTTTPLNDDSTKLAKLDSILKLRMYLTTTPQKGGVNILLYLLEGEAKASPVAADAATQDDFFIDSTGRKIKHSVIPKDDISAYRKPKTSVKKNAISDLSVNNSIKTPEEPKRPLVIKNISKTLPKKGQSSHPTSSGHGLTSKNSSALHKSPAVAEKIDLGIKYGDGKNLNEAKVIEEIIKHWNSLPEMRNVRSEKSATKIIRKVLEEYYFHEILDAMDNYNGLWSLDSIKLNRNVVTHRCYLRDFFGFSDYTKGQMRKSNIALSVTSWFDECSKGREYLEKTYKKEYKPKLPKDENPELATLLHYRWKKAFGDIDTSYFVPLSNNLTQWWSENFRLYKNLDKDVKSLNQFLVPAIKEQHADMKEFKIEWFNAKWFCDRYFGGYLKRNGYLVKR